MIGIDTPDGYRAYIEVEELPDRGTVGLRGLSVFSMTPSTKPPNLQFELGGGAEIFPGWGLSVDLNNIRLGILTVEASSSNNLFPYPSNGVQPPILSGDQTLQILPWLPLFNDSTYQADVLDNRGWDTCPSGNCLSVVYNQNNNSLDAANGAQLFDMDLGPITDPSGTDPSEKVLSAKQPFLLQSSYEKQMVKDLKVTLKYMKSNSEIPSGLLNQMQSLSQKQKFPIDLSPKSLRTSVAPSFAGPVTTIADYIAYLNLRGASPQELSLSFSSGPVTTKEDFPAHLNPRGASPQELNLPFRHADNYTPIAGATCAAVNQTCYVPKTVFAVPCTVVTAPLSLCNGFSAPNFRCPTSSDPLKPEDLPAAPGNATDLSLFNTIPPYYASRDNLAGTCGSHSATQYYEALLDRYVDDLAPKRVVYVDGLPVTVPTPRVAISVASSLWELYSWAGTHLGDPDLANNTNSCTTDADCGNGFFCCDPSTPGTQCNPPSPGTGGCRVFWPHPAGDTSGFGRMDPNLEGTMPLFLDAYWPAREGLWNHWVHSSDKLLILPGTNVPSMQPTNPALTRCIEKGFWFSGFCIAQGQPSKGVYSNYSEMVKNFPTIPLQDIPWSLGNTYLSVISHDIPLDDPDAAIQAVIAQLQSGLPVQLGFTPGVKQEIPDGHGYYCSQSKKACINDAGCAKGETCDSGQFSYYAGGITWDLPPELGGCSADTLNQAFGPEHGHAVNIVGYSVAGTLTNPDPFNSYFILENNWGKNAGYRSFFYMNFAAFRFLANKLTTYNLGTTCASVACEKAAIFNIPAALLDQFLYPPDPEGIAFPPYWEVIQEFLPLLAGVQISASVYPSYPGMQGISSIPKGQIPGSPVGIYGLGLTSD